MNENPQTPEEVGQWLRDHGGPVRSEGPDANGIVTQHAADGSYLRQQALPGGNTRVLEVTPAAAAVPGGDGSPPATTAPIGTGMDQKQLEALLAQFGTLGPGDFREEVKTEDVPNPKYDGTDVLVPQTIKAPVTYRTWVKPGTNQRLTVKVNPDGSYTQTFSGADASINPSKPNENVPQPPKEEPNPSDPTRMRRWNPKANGGQGAWEDAGPNAAGAQAAADRNKPGAPTLKPDGKGGTIAVQPMPDGTIKTTPLPGVPSDKPTPERVTVEGVIYERGPDGVYAPARGIPGPAAIPADMPPFRPDINKPGLGVIEYVQQLTALRASGKLTDKQYTEFVGHAHSQATSEASRLDTITRVQQQQQANEITQRSADMQASVSRLNTANTATQNALDTSQKMAGNFTPDTLKGAGPILPAVMALQDMRANQWGGMQQPPTIGTSHYPLLNQMGQMGASNPNTVIPAVADLGAQAAASAATTNQQITRLTQPPPAPAGPVTPAFTPPPAVPGLAAAPAVMPPTPVPATGAPYVPPPAAPVGTAPVQTTVQPVMPTATNGLPPGLAIPPTGTLPMPGAPQNQMPVNVPYPSNNNPNSVILPAVNGLGILSEVGASGKYPQDVLMQAAREMGLL